MKEIQEIANVRPIRYKLSGTNNKVDASMVYPSLGSNLNVRLLFVAQFNAIPNVIVLENINIKIANEWFLRIFSNEIKDCYYTKRELNNKKVLQYEDMIYFIPDDMVIYFDYSDSSVALLFRKTEVDIVDRLVIGVQKFRQRIGKKPELALLVSQSDGIGKKFLDIAKPKLSINDNYNDDFKMVHDIILKRLQKKNDKGIVLLHGKPGTGKTSYIKYLIGAIKKNVIFLPPNMASCISDPELISTLINSPNSIFVIEDAENIIIDRNKNVGSSVSALLNISDGLLSDCLNIQIICSFNTDLSKVDEALLRKGRLIARYEFKELEVQKAQALSDKLGFKTTIMSPMPLSAIYNQDDKEFSHKKEQSKIGFRAAL